MAMVTGQLCLTTILLLLLTCSAASAKKDTDKKEKDDTPKVYYTPPEDYDSSWITCKKGICKGSNATMIKAEGPHFTAYVYYDLPEWSYDKRVIFTSYVQPMPDDCEMPNDCDGRAGNNEFDMVETGYVGFNDTWFVNDNVRCDTKACNAQKCWNGKIPGCSWEGGPCKQGDYNNCNIQTDPDNMPGPCTWTDVQSGFSMCTQSAALDPMKQDFTQLSANAYVDGQTGVGLWQFMPKGNVKAVNNQRAFSVGTGDGKRWGNRWIRLDLELKGDLMWYTYRFFEPKPKNDTTAQVVSQQDFGLRSLKGKETFDKKTPHYWIFTLWQYDYEFAVPTNEPWDSTRYLHYHVIKDPTGGGDPTAHLIEKDTVSMRGSAEGADSSASSTGFNVVTSAPVLLGLASIAGLGAAALAAMRWGANWSSKRTVGRAALNMELPLEEESPGSPALE